MIGVDRYEVVAAAAIEMLKELVAGYNGPEEKLREYLLCELSKRNQRADALLARIMDEIL
ncbi:MAG: hypothetical protein ACUVTM_04015 [Candidatus Bathyarchaeia archaeon]